MRYNDVPQLDCQVEENNWLDVIYVQKKYQKNKAKKANKTQKRGRKLFYTAAVVVVLVGAVLGLAFLDTGFVGNIFQTAKDTFTSGIFAPKQQIIQLPANAEVYSYTNGDIVVGGGNVLFNISKGTVKSIDAEQGKVVVSISDKYDIVYSNLTEIMVTVGQIVEKYVLIGRYSDTATINVLKEGVKVSEVICQDYKLVWAT